MRRLYLQAGIKEWLETGLVLASREVQESAKIFD